MFSCFDFGQEFPIKLSLCKWKSGKQRVGLSLINDGRGGREKQNIREKKEEAFSKEKLRWKKKGKPSVCCSSFPRGKTVAKLNIQLEEREREKNRETKVGGKRGKRLNFLGGSTLVVFIFPFSWIAAVYNRPFFTLSPSPLRWPFDSILCNLSPFSFSFPALHWHSPQLSLFQQKEPHK